MWNKYPTSNSLQLWKLKNKEIKLKKEAAKPYAALLSFINGIFNVPLNKANSYDFPGLIDWIVVLCLFQISYNHCCILNLHELSLLIKILIYVLFYPPFQNHLLSLLT